MKHHVLAIAVTALTVACVSNEPQQVINSSNTTQQKKPITVMSPTKAHTDVEVVNKAITLEQIMADPDWIGRAPERWYWGDDSETVYFEQKQEGNPIRDLYRVNQQSKQTERVPLAEMHVVADRFAQKNKDGSKEVYVFKGNVFVKVLATGKVTQLTYTSAKESQAMFLSSGDVAYRVGNKFFQHRLSDNGVVELASLKMVAHPGGAASSESYLAQEQRELIDYIALQQRNSALKEQYQQRLKAQNSTVTTTEFYLGKNKRIVQASLSPNGDKLVVSIADKGNGRADTDIMPNYVTDNGDIWAERVRYRVANNRKYQEQLLLLDLKSGGVFPLSFDVLPGAFDDVLAQVKQENHEREGKTYTPSESLRHIHVMNTWQPIKWQLDGKQVAVMLEAWDNKDRWLATVNLLENKLQSQHRLHDEAWVGYTFNQFGWIGNQGKLFYLSEESGYSQLYTKSLKGKASALTQGSFEVSDIALSNDNERFYFKANIKHPGIYEVYSIDASGENLEQHTDLDGLVDYVLSPDEQSLLLAHSKVTQPTELYTKKIGSNDVTQITSTVSDKFKAMPWSIPTVVAIPSSYQEQPIYARIYFPKDYDKRKQKLRAVMFNHGAGYLQNAHLGWSNYFREFMFHSMLVQQDYVVIDMDFRASKGYGRDWRTAIYRHMGKPEVQDMLDGVDWLVENANVDPYRIGTYGGSYGGFLTLMALFTEPETFQAGAALRLVSDWAYYNHGYTSNILNTPGDDPIAYERSSPIYFAEGLTKPLLINAPMIDDNVFFQDTVRLVQRLIELEKQDFETAIYPVEPHSFVQPSSWLDEYRRIYKLFESNL
ncbi:prolyl oligopeptidase family serine peptidase [Thalassotalea euphylliae]|uniref:S9 family peptidase n=1 Tax=Thalassotalea euphylliae TaxID=1655234 RepID=UPI0036372833